MIVEHAESWESALLQRDSAHSLVGIARDGRLVREGIRVHLTAVDETVLALVDLALSKRCDLAFVYPAPAGDVAILLAAQILLQKFLRRVNCPSVGIVTADTVGANHVWDGLSIATVGSRTRLSEVFPCFRARPDGRSPFGRRPHQGVLVGQHFVDWPVDVVVVDHLSGSVNGNISAPAIHVFSDPLDPALDDLAACGGLIWGWSPADVAAIVGTHHDGAQGGLAPFSVAEERLRAVAGNRTTTVHVARHEEAERCVARIRDDLRTLANLFRPLPPVSIVKGLRVAWHHLSTLVSLPCRPSDFDRFAGVPPIAARATSTFEREIAAWAATLPGDSGEIASVIASDLGDLRTALDQSATFLPDLIEATEDGVPTLVVVRTHTAARAVIHALGGDPSSDRFRRLCVRSIRRLHREGTWDRAIVVGMPARWEWHRLDSGLSTDLHIYVLGGADAQASQDMLMALTVGRRRWGSSDLRGRVWHELVGDAPPPSSTHPEPRNDISLVAAHEFTPEPDPFAAFESLMLSSPLLVGDEGLEEALAEEDESGTWSAAVPAVDIETDIGTITLPASRTVEVRRGDRIVDVRANALEAGAVLLVGRTEGRLGLLEAMAERLQRSRPDLFAAGLIVSDLQASVRRAFRSSGLSRKALYDRLVAYGFEKTYHAVRGYVGDAGPLAPRDIGDLRRLNQALELGFSDRRILEIFAGVQRLRTFRRAAGRALAAAARGATIASDATRVDGETGLSLADLRDVVIEAVVVAVHHRAEPVALTELGRLERKE